MASVSPIEVPVTVNTGRLVQALDIIAKHATACADELRGLDAPEVQVDVSIDGRGVFRSVRDQALRSSRENGKDGEDV